MPAGAAYQERVRKAKHDLSRQNLKWMLRDASGYILVDGGFVLGLYGTLYLKGSLPLALAAGAAGYFVGAVIYGGFIMKESEADMPAIKFAFAETLAEKYNIQIDEVLLYDKPKTESLKQMLRKILNRGEEESNP